MNKKEKTNLIRILAAIVLIVLSKLTEKTSPVCSLILFAASYLTVGYDILLRAWKGIRKGQAFNENFLMAVATIGAIILGEYTEGAAVMIFYQIGELFESVAVGKSRKNITELMDIRPDYANICLEDGSIERVDPDEVEMGSVILIRPGEKVPIDGIIEEGESYLDTSALTGESKPFSVALIKAVLLPSEPAVNSESQQPPGFWIWWKMQAPANQGQKTLSRNLQEYIPRLSAFRHWYWRSCLLLCGFWQACPVNGAPGFIGR